MIHQGDNVGIMAIDVPSQAYQAVSMKLTSVTAYVGLYDYVRFAVKRPSVISS